MPKTATAKPAKAAKPVAPVEIVDLDEATESQVSQPEHGVKFCFNYVTVFTFPDGSTYHVQRQRATITDPALIANLKEAAKNPSNKIFIE